MLAVGRRRLARIGVAFLVALGVLLSLVAGSASATVIHRFEKSFDGSATPAKSFFPASVSVDNSSSPAAGDVYVGDYVHKVIDRFSASGGYECQITGMGEASTSLSECDKSAPGVPGGELGLALGQTAIDPTGDLYYPNTFSGGVYEFSASGAYVSSPFSGGEPYAVATDTAGNIYVANNAVHAVQKCAGSSCAVFAPASEPRGVAVDNDPSSPSYGDVYVGESVVKVYSPTGVYRSQLTTSAGNPLNVAVDPSTGDVYVTDQFGQAVDEFSPTGEFIYENKVTGGFPLPFSAGIDSKSGDLYVADLTDKVVDIYAPVVVPTVTDVEASGVTEATATLSGHVDPDSAHGGGEVTGCLFEYGTSTAYGQTAQCSPPTPYTTGTSVSASIALTPDTTYHFRLVATDANGSYESQDRTFTTPGPPVVDGESATAVTTSATARAQIDPFGYETSCQVQYVTEADFKSSGYAAAGDAPCSSTIPAGFGDTPVSATLSDLALDTVYHYRFVATNQAGTATGADQTFATFGIKSFSFAAVNATGEPFTQAGGHPYELIDTFVLNTSPNAFGNPQAVDANPKDVVTKLPAGLIGDPNATPKCSPYNVAHADCSGASQVGVMSILTARTSQPTTSPIYNLVPPKGLAAQLGARFNGFVTVHIDAKVRSGGDYGVTAEALETSAGEGVRQVEVRLWGVPAEASHDYEACSAEEQREYEEGKVGLSCGRYCPVRGEIKEVSPCSERGLLKPFLTEPTACGGPLSAGMSVDSWQEPGAFVSASSEMPAITGCERLDFKPTFEARPTSASTDSPTGLNVDLHIPQIENPQGLAEAQLKDATVALPAGLTVNPSAANGLEACSEAQMGYRPGTSSPVEFTPDPAQCPDAAKIGSVEVLTPLLEHPLHGGVYLAEQEANPFKSLLALYIAIDDPQTGVVIKLAGEVKADPASGRLTATFDDNPQVPFEDFKLNFFSGSRASLTSPSACGGYTTTTSLTPWSAPQSGGPATPSDGFAIDSGCAPGFAPSFTAGTASNRAGAFSPFLLSFSREDTEQQVGGLTFTMPPGVSAVLKGVPQCSNADAAAGACPAASRIGSVLAGSGSGADPYFLKGSVYLTGPYNGGPFGEAVVVPADAGPFHLGNVVVRGSIRIDPHTAQPTIVSDPFPRFVGSTGIPTDIRRVDVTLDRPGFTFNPTDCEGLKVTGALTSTGGASAAVSQRFQAADCRALSFKPGFTASVSARHSRRNGDSLHVVVRSGPGQANIRSVHVTLPKILPSRLETLNKACVDTVFEANPAACPAASLVGTATARTPLLAKALTGPVYFVSHGGAKFPDLVAVLQGEGITIDLVGQTAINHNITSSTFASVPDVPVTRFDMTLPAGQYSALTAFGNLCKERRQLVMPTIIRGQNGALIRRTTKVAVSGCEGKRKRK